MNEFIEDLNIYISTNFGSQSKYAEKLQVSRSFVSMVLKGIKKPSKQMLNDVGYEIKVIYHKK